MASTGVIGKRLDVEKIERAIPELMGGLSGTGGEAAAEAIMTTDSFPKMASAGFKISGSTCIISGIAKGAGMISPNMATMLAIFMTDVSIGKNALNTAFRKAIDESFNCITVDGDMSTNDMAVILANGEASNPLIKPNTADYDKFYSALYDVSFMLAHMIIEDGEGATRFVKVEVKGAKSPKDAEQAARQVANSLLLKTMIYGADPNPGRIVAALGASGIEIGKVGAVIYICGMPVFKKDKILNFSKGSLKKALSKRCIDIKIALGEGRYSKTIYTCDLTTEYININKGYS